MDNFDLPLMAFGGKLGRLHDLGCNPDWRGGGDFFVALLLTNDDSSVADP